MMKISRPKITSESNKMDSEDEESWEQVETDTEAAQIFRGTVFDLAGILLNLCLEEEKKHAWKYTNGKTKSSTKILVLKGLLELFASERLCEHYVEFIIIYKQRIDDRDDSFFLENDDIFPGAPPDDIKFFRDLWRPDSDFHLNPNEKESVFEYFDTMLHYCAEWKRLAKYVARWEQKSTPLTLSSLQAFKFSKEGLDEAHLSIYKNDEALSKDHWVVFNRSWNNVQVTFIHGIIGGETPSGMIMCQKRVTFINPKLLRNAATDAEKWYIRITKQMKAFNNKFWFIQ